MANPQTGEVGLVIAYFNGQFLPFGQIAILPNDRGFLFADGIYDVIRVYQGQFFKAEEHIARLEYGARELRFNSSRFDYLQEIARELLAANNLAHSDALIYIQLTRGVAPRSHGFPPEETPLTVFATVKPFSGWPQELENGINAILVPDQRWARCDIKSINLLANTLAHQQALDQNAAEAIFVRDGSIQEGTHSNVFIVRNGELITPPKTNYLLAGVTRKTVLGLCSNISITASERSVSLNDLKKAEEIMICGTTVEITPVVNLEGKNIGGSKPGKITQQLQQEFNRLKNNL